MRASQSFRGNRRVPHVVNNITDSAGCQPFSSFSFFVLKMCAYWSTTRRISLDNTVPANRAPEMAAPHTRGSTRKFLRTSRSSGAFGGRPRPRGSVMVSRPFCVKSRELTRDSTARRRAWDVPPNPVPHKYRGWFYSLREVEK